MPERPKGGSPAAGMTRRGVLTGTTALGVSGVLIGAHPSVATGEQPIAADPLSAVDPQLIAELRASSVFTVAGETLDEKRIHAMRHLLEINLKEIELLRQFDPEEEEPVTRFRPW